jgi:CDP-4-dehydro-6-deoxyglucose reductase, E1
VASETMKANYKEQNSELNSDFIFAHAAYNMRNNELGGILGLNQLPNLNKNVILRNRNHERFLSRLDKTNITWFQISRGKQLCL